METSMFAPVISSLYLTDGIFQDAGPIAAHGVAESSLTTSNCLKRNIMPRSRC